MQGAEQHLLDKLVAAFADLRDEVVSGKLAYPYSTRELVNMARHLQAFPADGPVAAVENVLAFDKHNTLAMSTLRAVLHRHGIPVAAAAGAAGGVPAVRLSSTVALPPAALTSEWHAAAWSVKTPVTVHALKMHVYEVAVDANQAAEEAVMHRLSSFSECLSSWVISERHGRATACAATADGAVHVLVSPLALHSYRAPDYTRYDRIDLSDYMAVLRAFGSHVQLHVLNGLDQGKGALAVISAQAGVCLLVHPSSAQITVCHAPALADFIQGQHEEADGYVASAESTVAGAHKMPAARGWQKMLGLKGGHDSGAGEGAGAEAGSTKLVQAGLQCRAVGDGKSLAMFVTGGSQVAILDFSTAPKMSIIDVSAFKGKDSGAGAEVGKAVRSGDGGGKSGGRRRLVGLHVLDASRDSVAVGGVLETVGARPPPMRWSWLLAMGDSSFYHAHVPSPEDLHCDGGATIEWVPLHQSRGGAGGASPTATNSELAPACIREVPGQGMGKEQGVGSAHEGGGGACVMYADGYFALYSDRSLREIDFETAAKGFVGVGVGGGLKVYGYARSDVAGEDGAEGAREGLPMSVLQGDVTPVVLPCGLVVTARYGRLPGATEDAGGGEEGDGQRDSQKDRFGGLLEVVDPLAGVLCEVSGESGVVGSGELVWGRVGLGSDEFANGRSSLLRVCFPRVSAWTASVCSRVSWIYCLLDWCTLRVSIWG